MIPKGLRYAMILRMSCPNFSKMTGQKSWPGRNDRCLKLDGQIFAEKLGQEIRTCDQNRGRENDRPKIVGQN